MQFVKDGGGSGARKKSKLPIASRDKEFEEPEEDGSHSLEDGSHSLEDGASCSEQEDSARGTEGSSGNEKSNDTEGNEEVLEVDK
jgi:hypothetical protein